MLRAADQEVVVRDPAIPGLAVLLDDEALGRWLSEQMQTTVRVHVRYLRYKHATSCVCAGDVDLHEERLVYAPGIGVRPSRMPSR